MIDEKEFLYHYEAYCVRVIDGDTIVADIDLGFDVWLKQIKIRFARINAPEIRGKERESGLKSKEFVSKELLGTKLILKVDGHDSWKRWIAEIYLSDGSNFNDKLVELQFAEYKTY